MKKIFLLVIISILSTSSFAYKPKCGCKKAQESASQAHTNNDNQQNIEEEKKL